MDFSGNSAKLNNKLEIQDRKTKDVYSLCTGTLLEKSGGQSLYLIN